MTVDELMRAAFKLNAAERASMAYELLSSLDCRTVSGLDPVAVGPSRIFPDC